MRSSRLSTRPPLLEKGVILSTVGAFFLVMSNTLACLAYLVMAKGIGALYDDFRTNWRALLPVGTADNLPWISFAFAATIISVAVALSESYGWPR